MIWGIFPYDWKISYESHLSGAVVGFMLSRYYKHENATFMKKKTQWEIEEELGIESDDLDGLWNQNLED
jgi:hypothetical protein